MTDGKGRPPVPLSDEDLCLAASQSCLRIPGVAAMWAGTFRLTDIPLFGRDVCAEKGIFLRRQEWGAYSLDIYLLCIYGVRIPQLAWTVQRKLSADLQLLGGRAPDRINIHVMGTVRKDQVGVTSSKRDRKSR